jgi:glycosyltransferase involved in cell wall biosynthesis
MVTKRVAHVLASLDFGGVEANALALIRGLPGDAIRSFVFYIGEKPDGRFSEFQSACAGFVHCPYSRRHRFRFVGDLASAFRQNSIDVVLSYSFGSHPWVGLAGRLGGVRRSYVRVSGSPLRDRTKRLKNLAAAHLGRPLFEHEVAVSNSIRDELSRGLFIPRGRILTIPNGCDTEAISRQAADSRRARGFEETPSVIMIARMDDAKDHPTLIRAASMLCKSGFQIRIRFAGDGPRRSAHEALAHEEGMATWIEFLGARADVPALLGTSDATVLATNTEGMPNVLLEAMSAGVPIVATDVPACREVLDGGRCGLLVRPRDPVGMAEAIRTTLTDEATRLRITSAGTERARSVYARTKMVAAYAALLSNGKSSPVSEG